MKRRRLIAGAGLAALGAPAWALQPALPAVLQRPALATPLAPGAAMLAAARAGTRVLAGGERGIVLTSDDAGRSWAQARVPVQASITAFAFGDGRSGWAVGHFGVILSTTDAGASWQLQLDGARAAQLTLEAAADESQRKAAQRKVDEGPDKPLFDIDHSAGRLLVVGAYGLALESIDGRSWRSFAHRLPNPKQLHLYAVRSAGERVFIAGEQGLLLRSSDRGASFETLASPYKGSFFGLLAARSGTLLAYGLRGNVYRSADAGSSWQAVTSGVPMSISAGLERTDGTLVLLAQNGDLLVSRDNGQHFERHPAARPFPAAAFVESADKTLILAGLRGLQRQDLA
jgi:photosystem II stability/assembly factor-like uncharacterized protein